MSIVKTTRVTKKYHYYAIYSFRITTCFFADIEHLSSGFAQEEDQAGSTVD